MFSRVLSEPCRVEFRCRAPNARAVSLVGPFNHWDPTATPMCHDESGEWMVELNLPPGLYHFKYVVDGHRCCYPERWQENGGEDDGECLGCVPNHDGTWDRVALVG